jgi:RNA polymerase sigma-70 factor (ECF subfamily)
MGRRYAAEEESDGAIVRRVLAGDVDAFELLVDRHAPRVLRIVSRSVPKGAASEVAHEAFVAAYLSLYSYVDRSAFGAWLARIALRACADFWRARGRETTSDESSELDIVDREPESPSADDRELLDWALAQLGAEDREVLSLVYFEGFSVKECAEVLSWGESKVKVRAHRARARLRTILGAVVPEREGRP